MAVGACSPDPVADSPTVADIVGPGDGPTAPPPGAAPESGTATGTVGVSWIWTQEDELAPVLDGFTGAATWYTIEWCLLEPEPGRLDWGPLDRNLARAQRFEIDVFLKVRIGSCWITGGARGEESGARRFTPSAMPAEPGDYQAFVTALVERAGSMGVTRYGIENEVNESAWWQGTVDEYKQVVELGAAAVRAADPAATVLDGGLSSGAYGWVMMEDHLERGDLDAVLETYQSFYERRIGVRRYPSFDDPNDLVPFMDTGFAKDSREYFDATTDLVRSGVVDGWQLHLYDPWTNAAPVTALIRARAGPETVIEAWEAGVFWPGGDGDLDALGAETARLFAELLAAHAAPVVFLPVRYDFTKGDEIRWGLVGEAVEPRPAGEFATLLHQATVGRSLSWRGVPGDVVHGAIGRDDEGTVAILWTDGSPLTGAPPGAQVWEFGPDGDRVTLIRSDGAPE